MASIEFTECAKRYDDVSVIEHLNLSIRDEEFMVFVGPSGCGKSTALRMIAGLEEVTEGQLKIGERVVNDVHPKDRDVAMVFQSYALYPHMSVRDNISFGLRLRKMPTEEIDKLVNDAADILGLQPFLDRKPKALSGGQRQRVALGRAIVRNPSVFLFDEPLSNLDAELRVQMRSQIAGLQRRLKTTMVYVTHDQIEAMTMGHRIAVLRPLDEQKSGNLMQCGTPLELYDEPDNVFVARFIGTPNMNIFPVTVSEDGGRLENSAFNLPAPGRFAQAAGEYRGRGVFMGIRPEHVTNDTEVDWENTATVSGEVEIIETIGHETILHVRCGDELIIAKQTSHESVPDYAEKVTLTVKVDDIHLFDKDSEKRLQQQA